MNREAISMLRTVMEEDASRRQRRLRVRGRYPAPAVALVQTLLRQHPPKVLARLFDVPLSSIYRWRSRECVARQRIEFVDSVSRVDDTASYHSWKSCCERAGETDARQKIGGELIADRVGSASASGKVSRSRNANERLDAARAIIQSDFFQDIDTTTLAARSGFSRYNFIRAFKARFSVSPHQYLLKTRMDAARKLLERSTESIAVVAAATGFQSANCLNRRFKQVEGRSISAAFPILRARKIRVPPT